MRKTGLMRETKDMEKLFKDIGSTLAAYGWGSRIREESDIKIAPYEQYEIDAFIEGLQEAIGALPDYEAFEKKIRRVHSLHCQPGPPLEG